MAEALRENLLDLDPDAALVRLGAWFAERGEPSYRATQLFARLWQKPQIEVLACPPGMFRSSSPSELPLTLPSHSPDFAEPAGTLDQGVHCTAARQPGQAKASSSMRQAGTGGEMSGGACAWL